MCKDAERSEPLSSSYRDYSRRSSGDSTVCHLLDTMVRASEPFSPSKGFGKVDLFERYRLHFQEQIQSLRQPDPEDSVTCIDPSHGRHRDERCIRRPCVLPRSRSSPRRIHSKAQPYLVDPHTPFPKS